MYASNVYLSLFIYIYMYISLYNTRCKYVGYLYTVINQLITGIPTLKPPCDPRSYGSFVVQNACPLSGVGQLSSNVVAMGQGPKTWSMTGFSSPVLYGYWILGAIAYSIDLLNMVGAFWERTCFFLLGVFEGWINHVISVYLPPVMPKNRAFNV